MTKSITFNERAALEKYANYILEDISRLRAEYKDVIGRLAKLDEIDNIHKGMYNNPIKTYLTEEIYETKKEAKPAEDNSKGETKSLVEFLQEYKEKAEQSSEDQVFTYDRQKEILKEKDYNNKPTKYTPSRRDVKKIAKQMANILKEAGRPISTSELISRLKDEGVDIRSPYVLIQNAMVYEKKIERAKWGYYQYKW